MHENKRQANNWKSLTGRCTDPQHWLKHRHPTQPPLDRSPWTISANANCRMTEHQSGIQVRLCDRVLLISFYLHSFFCLFSSKRDETRKIIEYFSSINLNIFSLNVFLFKLAQKDKCTPHQRCVFLSFFWTKKKTIRFLRQQKPIEMQADCIVPQNECVYSVNFGVRVFYCWIQIQKH